MKTLYRTAFALTKLEKPLNDIHKVAKVCYGWVFEPKPGKLREGVTRPALVDGNAKDIDTIELGSGWRLKSYYIKGKERRSWGMRVEHPDQVDAGIVWRTEVVVDATESKAVFTCRVEVLRADSNPAKIQRKAGQPGVVASVIENYGAKDLSTGIPLPIKPINAYSVEMEKLVGFLTNPARQQAVVLVSRQVETGDLLVDVELWAKKLSSLAYVMVAEDQKFSNYLGKALGKEFGCWDGAARIYYPGFTLESNRFEHSLLTPASITASIQMRGQPGLAEEIQSQITDRLAHRGYPGVLFWGDLRELVFNHRINQLKAGTDDAELAALYQKDNDRLRKDISANEDQIAQMQSDMASLWHWRGLAIEAIGKIRNGEDAHDALRDVPEVESVDEALRKVAEEHRDRLVLCLNSKSDPHTPFSRPTDVLNALRWLCTTFYDSKAKAKSIGNPNDSLGKVVSGWSYAGNQTDTTIGRFEEWYKVNYQLPGGKAAIAELHMKYGTGNDPVHMIRVAFLWDDTNKVWVIGYIGPHQKNTKS